MADFLPRRDVSMATWTRQFARGIAGDPAGLGLTAAQAAAYAVLQQAFAEALRAAQNPETRGLRTVMLKDKARKDLVSQTRVLARIIRAQPGVSKVTLLGLGLLRAGGESVGSVGEEAGAVEDVCAPSVWVKTDGQRVEVSLRSAGRRRRRPSGAAGAAVYWAVGEAPPDAMSGFVMAGNTTKPEMAFTLPAGVAPPGTMVWVTASWLDARLKPGRAAQPVSARVGYGQLLKAA